MSKKKKIKNLQKQVEDLETKLATQEETKETPKKRAAKTAVNVYFDSNFVNSLVTANEGRSSRERGGERLKKKENIADLEFSCVFFGSSLLLP